MNSNNNNYGNIDSSNNSDISNNSGTNQSSSDALNLETLKAQYNNLLLTYQQVLNDYMQFLQQQMQCEASNNMIDLSGNDLSGNDLSGNDLSGNDLSGNDLSGNDLSGNSTGVSCTQWIGIPQSVFWGSSSLSTSTASSVSQCKALCSADSMCSGATYNLSNQTCMLRSGEGNLIASTDSSNIAIIPENMIFLVALSHLNQQLTSINEQIVDLISSSQDDTTNDNEEQEDNANLIQNLQTQYQNLLNDRGNINLSIKEFETLNQEQQDSELLVNKYYASFLFWLFLVVIAIICLIMLSSSSSGEGVQSGGRLNRNAYYFIFGIIALTFFIYYFFIYAKK